MKDNTLPPVIKINNPTLAAVFGLTLATKRSTAENLVGKVHSIKWLLNHMRIHSEVINYLKTILLSVNYSQTNIRLAMY